MVVEFKFSEEGGVWEKALKAVADLASAEKAGKVAVKYGDAGGSPVCAAVSGSEGTVSVKGLGACFRLALAAADIDQATKHVYPIRSNFLRSRVDGWMDAVSAVQSAYDCLSGNARGGSESLSAKKKQQLTVQLKFSKEDLIQMFQDCETFLLSQTFLASEYVSCADVLLFAVLFGLSAENVLGKDFWSAHPNLTRWMHTTGGSACVTKAFGLKPGYSILSDLKNTAAWNVAMPAAASKDKKKEKKPKEKKKGKPAEAPPAKPAETKAAPAKAAPAKAAEAAPAKAPPAKAPPAKAAEAAPAKAAPAKAAEAAPAKAKPAKDQPANGSAKGGKDEEEDPVKKAKKAAKKAEKEAKKQKMLAKKALREKQEAEKKAKGGAGKSKAAKKAEEAAAKKKKQMEEEAATLKFLDSQPAGSFKKIDEVTIQSYSPRIVEHSWYAWWEKEGFFTANNKHTKGKTFTIVIPPPNVTGTLHLGHALTDSIEDTIVRWKRMSGFEALWVPGTDHAGIATQTVVEKKLMREKGVTRHDLGREKFLEEVHKFARDKKSTILNQIRRLGSSVDWTRERFTMDDDLQLAVKEAFCQMFEKGLIYRDVRLVNWCCHLNTALSDIEVDYIDIPKRTMLSVPGHKDQVEFGCITSFAYPLEDGSGEIVVATTRIETMLGDTAVAVHPNDPRYKSLHGKCLVHPVNGRKIPIITDAILVDMEFGTGAVKITPAHDPNDFATGQRHNLEFINVFDDNGLLNDNGTGPFKGMKRFECRVAIVDFLKEKGLFRGKEDNEMRLGLCSRSKDVIEPMLKPQWWVNCKDMGADAVNVVRNGDLKIIPKDYEKTWFFWMENIRDWCISRQLWWGHRIPAYYVNIEGESNGEGGLPGRNSEQNDRWVVGRTEADAMAQAKARFPGKKVTLTQDEDVLDTWFSSGLFPFSSFKWPRETDDLKAFFPTQLLETGHDILFFWVARMVMMSRCLMGVLPFKEVFLHAMVRDAHGRKMSKSIGNVIDPIDVIEGITLDGLHKTLLGGNLDPKEVEKAKVGQTQDYPDGIEECGTDALRFALCAYTSQGRDVNLDVKRVVGYRHWCNKLFNALRYAMLNLGDAYAAPEAIVPQDLPLFCKWILSRLNQAIRTTVGSMDDYQFTGATTAIYSFWQYDLCDVFIELVKPVMSSDDEEAKKLTRDTLWACLEVGLRLLHPFMPFLTEELWQRLPKLAAYAKEYPSITISPYPVCIDEFFDQSLDKRMTYSGVIVNKIRSLRTTYNLTSNKQKPEVFLLCSADAMAKVDALSEYIATLSNSSKVTCVTEARAVPQGCGVAPVDDAITAYVVLTGLVDPKGEIKRLTKKVKDCETQKDKVNKKIAMPNYDKTPDKFKEEDQEKMKKIDSEMANLAEAIAGFEKMLLAESAKAEAPAPKEEKAPEPKEEKAPEPKEEKAPEPKEEKSGGDEVAKVTAGAAAARALWGNDCADFIIERQVSKLFEAGARPLYVEFWDKLAVEGSAFRAKDPFFENPEGTFDFMKLAEPKNRGGGVVNFLKNLATPGFDARQGIVKDGILFYFKNGTARGCIPLHRPSSEILPEIEELSNGYVFTVKTLLPRRFGDGMSCLWKIGGKTREDAEALLEKITKFNK